MEQMKNIQFEKCLHKEFRCERYELPAHLRRVEQLSLNGTGYMTLFYRTPDNLIHRAEIGCGEDCMRDIGAFFGLEVIKISGYNANGKLYAHLWPTGVKAIHCESPRVLVELMGNLDKFPHLTALSAIFEGDGALFEMPEKAAGRLRYLEASNIDVKRLHGCSKLEELRLYKPQGFAEMPTLGTVYTFEASGLYDIAGIRAMPNVEAVRLRNCHVGNIYPVSGLEKLLTLDLTGNIVHDMTALTSLKGLKTFLISDNMLEDLFPLSGLNLTTLDLRRNPIEKLNDLEGHTNLEYLDIRETFVKDISAVMTLPRLRELWLDGEKLYDKKQFAALSPDVRVNGMERSEFLWYYKVNG